MAELHKEEIANAEANWNVSRIAIAGVIAWEALQNPQAFSVSSSGPGEMHLHGKSGHLSWPEVVERTGRMKSLPEILRKIELQSQMLPSITSAHPLTWQQLLQKSMAWTFAAIQKYLARSTTASRRTSGSTHMSKKPANEPFTIVPGTMGKWIQANQYYLQASVGSSLMR